MILTSIELFNDTRRNNELLRQSEKLHKLLLHALNPDNEHCERPKLLWRLESLHDMPRILTLSDEPLDEMTLRSDLDITRFRTGDYDTLLKKIETGQTYGFKLVANPIKKKTTPEERREAALNTDSRIAWMNHQASKFGFSIKPEDLSISPASRIKFYKENPDNRSRKHKISIYPTQFDGKLTVTDADAFKNILRSGIGHGKAYGLGLFSILPVY